MIELNLDIIFNALKKVVIFALFCALAYTVYNKPAQAIQKPAKVISTERVSNFSTDTTWGGRGW